MTQAGDFRIRCVQRSKARRHRLERCPHLNHLDDLSFGLTDDVDAPSRDRSDKTLLLEQGQGLTNRGAADPEPLTEQGFRNDCTGRNTQGGYFFFEVLVGAVCQSLREIPSGRLVDLGGLVDRNYLPYLISGRVPEYLRQRDVHYVILAHNGPQSAYDGTGKKFGDIYEVRDGLKEGERVVASANFLIDAESKVQGAVKLSGEPPRAEDKP